MPVTIYNGTLEYGSTSFSFIPGAGGERQRHAECLGLCTRCQYSLVCLTGDGIAFTKIRAIKAYRDEIGPDDIGPRIGLREAKAYIESLMPCYDK